MNESNKWVFWGLSALWFVFVVGVVWVSFTPYVSEHVWGASYVNGMIIALFIIWAVRSVRVVPVDEVALVLVYGFPCTTMQHGPKFIVRGLFQIEYFFTGVAQDQFPDEPEFVQKTPDEVPLETVTVYNEEGDAIERTKVRPIRISTKKGTTSSDDILNTQITVEVSFWVRWRVTDPYRFMLKGGGDAEGFRSQLRDSGESSLNEEITSRTASELVSDFMGVQTALLKKIKDDVDGWGVEIVGAGLLAPDLTHTLSSEMRNVASAKAKAAQAIITADAQRHVTEQDGIARANAKKAMIVATGEGYRESAGLMGVKPEDLLTADVARDTIGEGDIILGTDGISQAIGLGKKIFEQGREDRKIITEHHGRVR
ncbi:MAG TPA: SPFH domain-containing protein [Candidatus Paceibacterota bacterium]|nr:SPFH domain-containing protein [Candidatus Paceibacterota bacterium]